MNRPSPSIPNYSIGDFLGEGAFGEVFRASPLAAASEGADCAVKVVSPLFASGPTKASDRFLREADALRRLQHRSIVNFVNAGFTAEEPQRPYIVMGFIEGRTLSKMAPEMPFDARVDAIISILEALSYAHSKEVLHRDVKPCNIIIRQSDQQPILVDFGLAYIFEGLSRETLTRSLIGTMGYVPMEVQANPSMRTPQHDIYSCGISLFEILMGKLPVIPSIESLSKTSPDLVGLDPILRKALAPADARYKSADEFAQDLKAWRLRQMSIKSIEPSPRLESFKQKLLADKASHESRRSFEEARTIHIDEHVRSHHCQLAEIAEKTFKEVLVVLAEVHSGYRFERILPDNLLVKEKESPTPYFGIIYPTVDRKLLFGISWEISAPLGTRRDQLLAWDRFPGGAQVHRPAVQFVPPCWALYTEGSSQSPRQHLQGLLVCAIPSSDARSETPKVILYRDFMFSAERKELPPAPIQSPADIHDYFTYVLTGVLS